MRFDLALIHQLCGEAGLPAKLVGQSVEMDLGQGAILCFRNAERDEDCAVGFKGTPWHTHDDFTFVDGHGKHVEPGYLDWISGLQEGSVLICERWQNERLADRWLIHRDFNALFKYMEEGEQIIVRRATTSKGG